jgi:hypothetical protein
MTDPTSPMGSKRWTDLLQQPFIDSGLVGRYPPYAFRRGTGSMFKMKRGMLAAEEVAGHDQHGTTIRHYNRQPLFGLDIAGVLTGTTTYDQVETYLQFAPARMWRWSSTGNETNQLWGRLFTNQWNSPARQEHLHFATHQAPHTYYIEFCRKMGSRLSLQVMFHTRGIRDLGYGTNAT